jgi:hypothetical protein
VGNQKIFPHSLRLSYITFLLEKDIFKMESFEKFFFEECEDIGKAIK